MSKVKSGSLEPAESGAHLTYDTVIWPDCCPPEVLAQKSLKVQTPLSSPIPTPPEPTQIVIPTYTPSPLRTISVSVSTMPWRLTRVYTVRTTERKQVVKLLINEIFYSRIFFNLLSFVFIYLCKFRK